MTSQLTRCVLEVERKFHSLAVPILTQYAGKPAFRSLKLYPPKLIHDVYYDHDDLLSAAGTWVRKRNGSWQAKVRKGGNYENSQFEELHDKHDIWRHIGPILAGTIKDLDSKEDNTDGDSEDRKDTLGLLQTADITTQRQTWLADDEFRIVLDTMDFGHQVGEVELQQMTEVSGNAAEGERQKKQMMQAMDQRVVEFIKRYSWAFVATKPKGKLTAYFEKMR